MTVAELLASLDRAALGERMHALAGRAFPICRSITGDGVRRTLELVRERVPLVVTEVPSGTQVLDWVVPPEWNIREAWIADRAGRRIVDFQESNLHVVGYSEPVRARMGLAELRPRLHTLPGQPDLIPYRTSYYERTWGFCLPHHRLEQMQDTEYDVCIDSTLEPGSLTYGELLLPGTSAEEVLISCHVCHPSLANDNLSGLAVATQLAELLGRTEHRYSYRFLFVPATIGAITWLARNPDCADRVRHGLVLTCVGDSGDITYKRSRRGTAPIDRAAEHVLRHNGAGFQLRDFSPIGYDERQYCSPGFDLATGCFMRSPHGTFPEYHTSADNMSFIRPAALSDSLMTVLEIFRVLEDDRRFQNLQPYGEPQLGRRGLYRALGGETAPGAQIALLWVLNLSDGHQSLLDIAERARLPFGTVARAADILMGHELLRETA